MDQPARKRRKTASPEGEKSPTSPLKQPPRRPSLSSRSYITAEDRRTSPLKAPPRRFSLSPAKGASGRPPSPSKEPPRRLSRRPSFASPTRASLARGHPDLLQRPVPSALPAAIGPADMFARGKEARAFILGGKDGNLQTVSVAARSNENATAAGAQIPPVPNRLQNSTPRAQRTKRPAVSAGPDEDPDLPSTPSQRVREEQYTSRPGLFSSPSKQPPRLRNSVNQSPLTKHPLDVQHVGADIALKRTISHTENEIQPEEKGKKGPTDSIIGAKKYEKARLTKELKAVEEHISHCDKELSQINAQASGYIATSEERASLLNLINDLDHSEGKAEERRQSISSLLCSFLPFSTCSITPTKPALQKQPASHHPVELSEPLSYLQLFTSLRFNTRLSKSRGHTHRSNLVQQRHLIDIVGPQSLLTVQISITINVLTNTVLDSKLLYLSHWADRELGAFIHARLISRDLGNACWAMNSYWNLAKKRAEYWRRCETAFPSLIPGRSSKDMENVDVRNHAASRKGILRKDLYRHLGRDTITLENRHVMLKINWQITFDWTGEVESTIGVMPAVPLVCKFAPCTLETAIWAIANK